jgi:hypothetical protein
VDDDPNTLLQAYHLASQNNDSDAMEDLHGRILSSMQKQNAAQFNPTNDMGTGSRLLAGAGHGLERFGRGTGNLVGLGHVFPSVFGDESLKEDDQVAQPLMDTTAGKVGDLAGQIAATAPLGMGTGALTRALGTRLAGAAAGATPRLAAALRALNTAQKVGTAGGENAAQSAAMADPDQQGSAALSGAALGGGLNLAGKVGGRALRGIVNKSEPAQNLITDAAAQGHDLFIPISQGAEEGGLSGASKAVYGSMLPYAIGVEKKLERQSDKASATMRDVMAERGMPFQEDPNGQLAQLKANLGNTPEQTSANVKQQFRDLYDQTLKGYAFNAPSDFRDRVISNLKAEHPDIPDSISGRIGTIADENLGKYSENGTITGGNLQEAMGSARSDLDHAISRNEFRSPAQRETAIQSFKDIVDDAVTDHQQIASTSKNPNVVAQAKEVVNNLQNYQRLGDAWKETAPWTEAAEKAGDQRGAFNFSTIAKNAEPTSVNRSLAQDATQVLQHEDPGGVNPAGRHAAHVLGRVGSGLGAATILGMGHPLGAAALIGVPNMLASKVVQKGLYGDLGAQQALARAIRQNPQKAYSLGLAGRSAVNAERQ